jgi:hypothetical protein
MIIPVAGQVWRAETAKGKRWIRVDSVRRGDPPRVLVIECTKAGGNLRKAKDGFKPDLKFSITLTCDDKGNYTIPSPYVMETK